MNGRDLTLGIVAGLAVAGAVRQRGGRNHLPTLYHVTTREAADDILRNGFLPGWGDIGLGVYFYGSEREAMRYAQKGGWDGALRGESVVVLAVQDPHIRRMGDADLDPSWDRSKYADMWFWEGRDEDAYMVPSRVSVAADLGVVVPKGARKGSASLNHRGARNAEALRNDLLPAALRDAHDLVVTETQSRNQLWEPTGVGSGVRPVTYRYHTLVATLYPRGRRNKDDRLGQVAATSERRSDAPVPLRGRCADDLVRLNGPAYAFGVTGAFVDESLRGKGVGQALYAALVEAAGAHGGALTSNRCLTGTELTSGDALRVWERLGRRYRVEGEVAWQPKGSAARGSRAWMHGSPHCETVLKDGIILPSTKKEPAPTLRSVLALRARMVARAKADEDVDDILALWEEKAVTPMYGFAYATSIPSTANRYIRRTKDGCVVEVEPDPNALLLPDEDWLGKLAILDLYDFDSSNDPESRDPDTFDAWRGRLPGLLSTADRRVLDGSFDEALDYLGEPDIAVYASFGRTLIRMLLRSSKGRAWLVEGAKKHATEIAHQGPMRVLRKVR